MLTGDRSNVNELFIVKDIELRKKKYIGHKSRVEDLFMLIVQGKMIGKPTRGRKRMEYITTNNIRINKACDVIKVARERRL